MLQATKAAILSVIDRARHSRPAVAGYIPRSLARRPINIHGTTRKPSSLPIAWSGNNVTGSIDNDIRAFRKHRIHKVNDIQTWRCPLDDRDDYITHLARLSKCYTA